MDLSDLTIIIPTINRPSMLRRTLDYYVKSNISSKIILADSSNEESKKHNSDILYDFSKKLEIEYFHVSQDTSLMKKMSMAADKVNTPYVLEVGDDDFLLRSSLLYVMNELEKDKTIAAGYGHRLGISAISEPTSGMEWINVFPFYDMPIENTRPLDRIRHLTVPCWQQYPYSIYRKEVLQKAYQVVRPFKAAQYVELFQFAAVLSQGKWKKFDLLFAVCNTDSDYYRLRSKSSFPIYWGYKSKGNIATQISNPIWSKYISELTHRVSKLLAHSKSEQDDIAILLTRTYWAINNKYLEQHGLLSSHLFHDDEILKKKLNLILSKFNKIIYALILPDRNGGINAWYGMIYGLLKEVTSGRIIRNRVNRSIPNNFKKLLSNIKRTGSLDYELANLIESSSKHYDEFSIIFESWVSNPCPKAHSD